MVVAQRISRGFSEVKPVSVTSECVMAHYDEIRDTQLRLDASPVGVGENTEA